MPVRQGAGAAARACGLILDLRNTPSGGNTDVAEPILGRFVSGRPGYQRVFDPGPGKRFPRDSWVRWVRARGPFRVASNLVVLCDRWTGSMGEGMTVGLDALGRAEIVGTRMAGLCGATSSFTLPKSGIGVNFPTERLYHSMGARANLRRASLSIGRDANSDVILARGVAAAS